MEFRWVPRTTGCTGVFACSVCCVPLCYQEDVQVVYSTYVRLHMLHVVNVLRVTDGEAFCLLDHFVGRVDGDNLFLYRPTRLAVAPRTDAVDGVYPREWAYSRGASLLPVWGCVCCRRPIGVGYEYVYHFAQPISFVNVAQCTTDPNIIRCLCGCYIGFRYRQYVLVGDVLELTAY